MASDEQDGIPSQNHTVPSASKEVFWYRKDIIDVPGPVRQLLEKYSGIEPERVKEHILRVRDQAWNVRPYPCIGLFRFLDLSISQSPSYAEILSRLQQPNSQTLVDLGCCFGQDVRKLIFDGAPMDRVYGADLHEQFIEAGYELFRDRDRLPPQTKTFFVADVFDQAAFRAKGLEGNVDMIHAASFIHLFDYEGQVRVCKRLVQMLRPPSQQEEKKKKQQQDVLILGRQVGNLSPGEYPNNAVDSETMFRHDEQTFKEMWDRVGRETGTKWRVEVELKEMGDAQARSTSGVLDDEKTRSLVFVVRREA